MKRLILVISFFLFYTTAFSQWTTDVEKDEMTGEMSAYAMSPSTTSTKPMDFPYNSVTSKLVVGCDKESMWVYLYFSESPNLSNTEMTSNGSNIDTRAKWGDEIEPLFLSQKPGSKFVHFRYGGNGYLNKIKSLNTVLVELDWYGNSGVYFEYSLAGSSSAINKIQKSCGQK